MTRRKNSSLALVPARKQRAFRRLRAALDREDIASCLVMTGDERADRLLDMLHDPAYSEFSFGQLCSRAGLSAAQVAGLYCQRQVDIGRLRMSQHLPAIMEDLALAARAHSETCTQCKGEGQVGQHVCPRCEGTGTVRVLGDMRAVNLMFRMFGLIR